MASWLDLPIELRVKIVCHVFHKKIFRYLGPHRNQFPNQIFDLMLVSKSFAPSEEIISTMLSETALRIEKTEVFSEIKQNSKHSNVILSNIRRISIVGCPRFETSMTLSDFQAMLPRLKQIHIHCDGVGIRVRPAFHILTASKLFPLLQPAAEEPEEEEYTRKILSLPHSQSIYAWDDYHGVVKQKFDLMAEYRAETIMKWRFMDSISNALSWTADYAFQDTIDRTKWLGQLLVNDEVQGGKLEVTLSWKLDICIDQFDIFNSENCIAQYVVEPAFFSTKDMSIRFLIGDTEVVIPQHFGERFDDWSR